jgi:hypothetical protein
MIDDDEKLGPQYLQKREYLTTVLYSQNRRKTM